MFISRHFKQFHNSHGVEWHSNYKRMRGIQEVTCQYMQNETFYCMLLLSRTYIKAAHIPLKSILLKFTQVLQNISEGWRGPCDR